MPITKEVENKESYTVEQIADGSWELGIHTKDDFLKFNYRNPKDLLASLADEIGSSKKEVKEDDSSEDKRKARKNAEDITKGEKDEE